MSQQDHDLTDSVLPAGDQASNPPASPPRRDPMEDADSSLTRKRPRLDDGTSDNRTMPTDSASPSHASSTDTTEQLVEMTIRSQPPSSSQPTDGAADSPEAVSIMVSGHKSSAQAMDDSAAALPGEEDAPGDSPPVIAVDDAEDEEDAMGDYTGEYMHINYNEEDYFRKFPFANGGNYMVALRQITAHFVGSASLDGTVLPQISVWLDSFPNRPSHWKNYYLDRIVFWEEFAGLVAKVLARKYAFGESFCDDEQDVDEIFYPFFRSYVQLCSRLLRADADMLSSLAETGFGEQYLVTYKHLRHLSTLVRPEKSAALFHVLQKDYAIDVADMGQRLVTDFVRAKGIEHTFQFLEIVWEKITPSAMNWYAPFATHILGIIGWHTLSPPPVGMAIDRPQFCRNSCDYFRRCDALLQAPGKVVDVGVTKDLVSQFSTLLAYLCQWDDNIAVELVDELLDFGDPESPTRTAEDSVASDKLAEFRQASAYYPALVSNAWKFKLLRKYVVKGRMELRVMSIGTMDGALVDIWREYNSATDAGTHHPVMQYLAEFLLHERVTDYIISVDSHPQIIQRSGNIVGFLVVTHRYSERQTDAIWNTISHSQDPRVITATLTLLRGIINLMDFPELVYLSTKFYDLPIEKYNLDILRFLRDTTDRLKSKWYDWSSCDYKARPWNIAIRIIQDTSPNRNYNKLSNSLHTEASEQLRYLTSMVGPEERREIYSNCASHVENRSEKATGSVCAVQIICAQANSSDVAFFKRDLVIVRHFLEELCSFVEAENQQGDFPLYATALIYRLDFLRFLVQRAPEAIPVDLYQPIWDHTVGKHALNNDFRDMAWGRLSELLKTKPDSGFCAQLISDYVPCLDPAYFTLGLYSFVASYRFPTSRQVLITSEGEQSLLQIRGEELLWRMILDAPSGTIEDHAAKLLASRYVEIDIDNDASVEDLEEAHVHLVEKCTQRLLSTYNALRSKPSEDNMDTTPSDSERHQMETQFARTVLFQKLLLKMIRLKPEFSRTARSDSKVGVLEPEAVHQNAIEITYNVASMSGVQSIYMTPDNTLRDLEFRLCASTGFTKIYIIFMGKKLNLDNNGDQTLAEIGMRAKAHLLLQKAPGSETRQPTSNSNAGGSVFEMSILKHFDALFNCMDSDDSISIALSDFLGQFPYHERITDEIASGTASADKIFPPGKPFQAIYAAYALQNKLREQLRRSTLDDAFLSNAVALIEMALSNHDLLGDTFTSRHEFSLASALLTTFVEFLKERPAKDVSACYFSAEPSLVDRLMKILHVALAASTDQIVVVWPAYAAILEASLHSRGIWDAFVAREDGIELHKALLLTDSRRVLREHTGRAIASVSGGHLPSTSPLTSTETATHFWAIISKVLPAAVQYPTQAEQLFSIAEQVFLRYDEDHRDEQALRTSMTTWSELLLNYKHEEFVGRDEVDFVVLGFTRLLLYCVTSLKSFKKPLDAGSLMEQIFKKFLFVPKVYDVDEDGPSDLGLPVLESNTRKELYDLVLALAEDRTSYSTLLDLVATSGIDTENTILRSYAIERAAEIRSSTGYVGLYNPRAICYMNSLLTQLFMNVDFRKFLLGINVTGTHVSQRLLSETQSLFARMQNSFRKAADPRDFAACIRGLDGQPIDINIQMDADEFYNLLFDQWESQMLSTEAKQRFRTFYGGQTVNQIKSKECEHVSERVEGFFVVQCDVQGKANLLESLQAFVEGDVMEGDNKYKCESCGGKFVDAVKRTCLKDVPDNLIFHLKRFDFDLVDMRRAKINDHFAFPDIIDVSLYNIDYLSDTSKPREEDIFELVGVLVHQGTSENGHYYSYIRERPSSSGSGVNWVEFNDRDVDNFDHQSIPHQAFGGFYDDQFQRQPKQFSAYMLFYQRRTAIEKDHHEYIVSPHCGSPKVPIPPELEASINADNELFVREHNLLDPNHSKFIRQILATLRTVNDGVCSEDHQQEAEALRAVLSHLCQVIIRQRNLDYFDETIAQLRRTALSCPVCCQFVLKWLGTHDSALLSLLLQCPNKKVRSQMRNFLIESLVFIREKDSALYYGGDSVDSDMENGTIGPIDGVLLDIVHRLSLLAEDTYSSIRGWDDYYLTLICVCEIGYIETAMILNTGMLEFCLKIFCMHASSQFRLEDVDLWRIMEKKKPVFNRMIEFVYHLLARMDIQLPICNCYAKDMDRLTMYDRATGKFPLGQIEVRLLRFWDDDNKAYAVLDRMIEIFDCTKTEAFYPGDIFKWLLETPDQSVQERLMWTLVDGITSIEPPFQDNYIRAAVSYCEACPRWPLISKVLEAVVTSTTKLRDSGGEVALRFFAVLPNLDNEHVLDEQHVDRFYLYALEASPTYAVPLLIYDDPDVRKGTASHLDDLFRKVRPDEFASNEALRKKYRIARTWAPYLIRRIVHEHQNGSPRVYMTPLIQTCGMIVSLLLYLANAEEPALVALQHPDDMNIVQQYHQDIENRVRIWAYDEGTPISTGETYEHSDYGSDSEEPDALE